MSIDTLIDDFTFLDQWEDRYRFVIELGQNLDPLSEAEHAPGNKVQGCVSQVWIVSRAEENGEGPPHLYFRGDSDAHIVRGLIAVLLKIYNGKTPADILAIEPKEIFHKLGLDEHLSPQRSNGLYSMVNRIRADAANLLAGATSS